MSTVTATSGENNENNESMTNTSDGPALMTIFTPPASCTQSRFTMIVEKGYEVWLNEPVPASFTTLSSCYPPNFISFYSTSTSGLSDVPAMNPLVCPQSWESTTTGTGNYIACCPPGFRMANLTTTIDDRRPFYGGTCYSELASDQVLDVVTFNRSPIDTGPWTISRTTDQVFAHPIDGYALRNAEAPVTSSGQGSSSIPSSSSEPSARRSDTRGLSGGSIAGIVAGSVAGLAICILVVVVLLRRRSSSQQPDLPQGQPANSVSVAALESRDPNSPEVSEASLSPNNNAGVQLPRPEMNSGHNA